MTSICVHISDGFPVLSFTLISEPLRVANRELGSERFRWHAASDKGGVCLSSSGIPLETTALPRATPDSAILLASYRPDRSATDATLSWLRRLDLQGCLLGCVDTGASVFAKAGLLNVRPAAVHPEAIAGFQRQFPGSLFIDRLFDFSPPRFSSAGGVATLDMTLALIGHFTSNRVARRVSEVLTYRPPMQDWQPAPLPLSIPSEVRDAVSIMEAHSSSGIVVSEIANRIGLPVWKLNRQFRKYLHCSTTTYYVSLRLARARDMLRNTTLQVGDIALECGYENQDAFSRAYRSRFGVTPSNDRAASL